MEIGPPLRLIEPEIFILRKPSQYLLVKRQTRLV